MIILLDLYFVMMNNYLIEIFYCSLLLCSQKRLCKQTLKLCGARKKYSVSGWKGRGHGLEGRKVWLLKDDSPFGSLFLPFFLPFPCLLLFGIPFLLGRDCGQVPHSQTHTNTRQLGTSPLPG